MGLEEGTAYTNAMLGVINGVYAAGGAIGCVFNMWSSEFFGRKRSIQIGCVISIVGATIMTASVDIPMFVVARFIMGFGIGVLVTLVPLYQSEVSPPESRGLMVGLHGVLIGFSYAMTGFVTYGCYFAPYGAFQWYAILSPASDSPLTYQALPTRCSAYTGLDPAHWILLATILATLAPLQGQIRRSLACHEEAARKQKRSGGRLRSR